MWLVDIGIEKLLVDSHLARSMQFTYFSSGYMIFSRFAASCESLLESMMVWDLSVCRTLLSGL